MAQKLKKLISDRINLILWAASFLYTLPVYNKYWAPFDEGIIAVASQMWLSGKVPYKDFFIAMYPPGQIYALGIIFKIFNYSLIAGRIYAVLLSVGLTMLVFFMTRAITKNTAASLFAWLAALSSLAPRLGAIPTPIWPGIFLSMLSIYLFMVYLERPKKLFIFLAGLACGTAIFFRHDIGLFAAISIFIPLFVRAFRKRSLKDAVIFAAPVFLITGVWVAYFVKASAFKDLIDSLIMFTFVHQKTASIAFPLPCLDLKMIFHGSLGFISINQFYIPIIVYACAFLFMLSAKIEESTKASMYAILLFGILTFNQVRIRTDPAHLLTVISPAFILSGFILNKIFSVKLSMRPVIVVKYITALLIVSLIALLIIKNTDKYIKNTYTKPYRGRIVKTVFDRGGVYIPAREAGDVFNAVEFLKNNTIKGEKIYIGNASHDKDDFGGATLIYFLADRAPSTKFYEILPGLITRKEVQEEIIYSLDSENVRMLVIQEEGPAGSSALDRFIRSNYKPAASFGKYRIYRRKGII